MWDDMTYHFWRHANGEFAGCYFFHKAVHGSPMIAETFVMDDTSCIDYFQLTLVVILAIDEHSLSQLVAFALLPDRIKESFIAFLL
jgi:hypothetical protein